MARYSAGSGSAAIAARTVGQTYVQIRAGANAVTVYEVGIFAGTAVVCNVAIVRATAVGTQTTTITPAAETSGTPLGRLDTAFSTHPTAASVAMRNIAIPAAIGNGYTFVFPDGILVPASGGLLVHNPLGTSGTFMAYAVWDE